MKEVKESKSESVKLSSLKLDENLLRLRKINVFTVNRYRQNYREGAIFPDMIVEAKSMRVISGNHRYKAMAEEYGLNHKVNVRLVSFNSERDAIEFFAKENIEHGEPLTGISRRLIALELGRQGASSEDVARLFNVSVKRIMDWSGHSVMVIGERQKSGSPKPMDRQMPVKYGLPMERVTETFYKSHIKADRGVSVVSQATQLSRWLNNGDVNCFDKESVSALKSLQEAINQFMKEVEKKGVVA